MNVVGVKISVRSTGGTPMKSLEQGILVGILGDYLRCSLGKFV